MTGFKYVAPARSELRSAARYYLERSPRAAALFMAAVQKAVEQILDLPDSAPIVRGEVRGKVVLRFPYTLMYQSERETIVILAVAHHRQHPLYWVDRVG